MGMSDTDVRGLWRAIDDDRSSKVSVKEFMAFMRIHGKAFDRLHNKPRKAEKTIVPLIERSREQLKAVVRLLEAALTAYWAKRGVHTHTDSWGKFFGDADRDGSGRLTFDELSKVLIERLRHKTCTEDEIVKGVTRDDLIALWNVADADRSSEVTAKEWALCLYRIEIEEWPDYDAENLRHVVDIINEAAQRWHRAGGNWYKVFKTVDTDGSGEMGFDSEAHAAR